MSTVDDGQAGPGPGVTPDPVALRYSGTLPIIHAEALRTVDYSRLLVEHIGVLDQIVRALARRYAVSSVEAEDLASAVKLKLVENDYQALRRFEGRSSFHTYLTIVVHRVFLDRRNADWGKWRPSVSARRAGPIAVLLDRLMTRDGYTFDEALIDVNYFCRLATIILAGPRCGRGCDSPRPVDVTTGRSVFRSSFFSQKQ